MKYVLILIILLVIGCHDAPTESVIDRSQTAKQLITGKWEFRDAYGKAVDFINLELKNDSVLWFHNTDRIGIVSKRIGSGYYFKGKDIYIHFYYEGKLFGSWGFTKNQTGYKIK